MRITWDRSADAAYIYLTHIPPGGVARTVALDADNLQGVWINLDFDGDRRLLGIEVINASKTLPVDALQLAEQD